MNTSIRQSLLKINIDSEILIQLNISFLKNSLQKKRIIKLNPNIIIRKLKSYLLLKSQRSLDNILMPKFHHKLLILISLSSLSNPSKSLLLLEEMIAHRTKSKI